MDLAPTILAALGLAKGPAMEGHSLLDRVPREGTRDQGSNVRLTPDPQSALTPDLSADEEELIRERLRGLGYI
jgi:arylsulfatase A-like enzyme